MEIGVNKEPEQTFDEFANVLKHKGHEVVDVTAFSDARQMSLCLTCNEAFAVGPLWREPIVLRPN